MVPSTVLSSIVLFSVLGKYISIGFLIREESRGLGNGICFVGVHKGIGLNTLGLCKGIDILGLCGLVNRSSNFFRHILVDVYISLF